MSRGALLAQLVVATFLVADLTLASHPVEATHQCDDWAGAFDLDAYEAEASGTKGWKNIYARSAEFAAFNQLFPELPSFALPKVEVGPRSDGSSNLADPYIPPVILKAIGWIESSWAQACPSVPYGDVGPVLVSHDFGYGIMQITSGMGGGTVSPPNLDQVMIGSHYGFNIARGAKVLMEKWNAAPTSRPIVGNRVPDRVESWYYAVWGYNGFSFVNHPSNPSFPFPRSRYLCDGTQPRSNYPYQELIFGCMKHPPVSDSVQLWNPVAATLPDLSDPAFAVPLGLGAWNACSDPGDPRYLDCSLMDIPIPAPSHIDVTAPEGSRSDAVGSPALSVSPLSIILVASPAEQPEPVPITITNSGTGPLAVRLVNSDTWLKLGAGNGVALGTDLGSESLNVTLSANAAGLSPGTYTGEVKIASLYPQVTRTVNVTLFVDGQRTFVPGIGRN